MNINGFYLHRKDKNCQSELELKKFNDTLYIKTKINRPAGNKSTNKTEIVSTHLAQRWTDQADQEVITN